MGRDTFPNPSHRLHHSSPRPTGGSDRYQLLSALLVCSGRVLPADGTREVVHAIGRHREAARSPPQDLSRHRQVDEGSMAHATGKIPPRPRPDSVLHPTEPHLRSAHILPTNYRHITPTHPTDTSHRHIPPAHPTETSPTASHGFLQLKIMTIFLELSDVMGLPSARHKLDVCLGGVRATLMSEEGDNTEQLVCAAL